MQKILPILIILSFLFAIPATTNLIEFVQPDGNSFTGFIRGDEWLNWYEQADGYTIAQNSNRRWMYVMGVDDKGNYILSDIPAHEKFNRKSLSQIKKHIHFTKTGLRPDYAEQALTLKGQDRNQFELPLLVVDFPNLPYTYEITDFDDLMNQIGYSGAHGQTGSFRDFYMENSYGNFDPHTTVLGWFQAAEDYQVYGSNAPDGWDLVRLMIAEAIDDAEAQGVDWTMFDNDNDGSVDALNVVHAGPGAEEGNGSYIWSHKWNLGSYARYYDGVWIDNYTINPEMQGSPNPTMVNIGVICHEFGHALGLPDLYDTDYSSSGLGTWALMSGGSWGGNGNSPWYPAHLCAWSKVRVGWVIPVEIADPVITIDLPNVEENPIIYKMNGVGNGLEYFLFENRQQIKFDQTLRNSGLMIWHVDETQWGNSEDFHYQVDLEQADGYYHLNYGTNNGDMGDSYPGSTNNTIFTFDTNPNSQFYNGEASGVSVINIIENDDIVTATFRNLPLLTVDNTVSSELFGDNDGVPNPGETIGIVITFYNPSSVVITDLSGIVETNNPDINILSDEIQFSDAGALGYTNNIANVLTVEVSETAPLGSYDLTLLLSGNIDDGLFEQEVVVNFELTINQAGFPYVVDREIKSSPAIVDLDQDGDREIIFCDLNGKIYVLNSNGSIEDGQWPFDTGNQIWSSPAIADIDNDGITEIVITSKSKHLYVLDPQGNVELDYNTGQFLVATPALGNLDEDDELEIVFGSVYISNSPKIFAINTDGTNVSGFPIDIDEKIYVGVALTDFNENGKDDIVVATQAGNLYLIYDNGEIAPGFPFTAENDFRSAPSVLDVNGDKIIFAGSKDGNFYAVNADGSLQFEITTGGEINTSPGIVEFQNSGTVVFFGSNDGSLYAISTDGVPLTGWPRFLGSGVVSAPVFADLDGDGEPEVISANESGNLFAFHSDGAEYIYFPIETGSTIQGSPSIADVDLDGDLEIMIGTVSSLVNIDVKETGNAETFWNTYRGNLTRTGNYQASQGAIVNHLSDWNLVGLPMNVTDSYHLTVFPDAIEGSLYSYEGTYLSEDDLVPGKGYWLRFTDAGANTILGVTIDSITIPLMNEWNLISGISGTVNINNIFDPEDLIIPGTFYSFNGAYESVSDLVPGKGYWLRSNGVGEIIISNSQLGKRTDFADHLGGANTISFNGSTLYFGIALPDEVKLSYGLPPKPPQDAFDVRFVGDRKCVEDYGEIEIMNNTAKLKIDYNVKDGKMWILSDTFNGMKYEMEGVGEMNISGDFERFILKKQEPLNIPDSYVLYQNFPNPFNPVTTITYSLPEESYISIAVFNLAGSRVRTLVDKVQRPGIKTILWDATNEEGEQLSSGIYFLQMRTEKYSETMKMMLIR